MSKSDEKSCQTYSVRLPLSLYYRPITFQYPPSALLEPSPFFKQSEEVTDDVNKEDVAEEEKERVTRNAKKVDRPSAIYNNWVMRNVG